MSKEATSNKGLIKTIIRAVVVLAVAICLVVVVILIKDMVTRNSEPEITTSSVSEKLEECSELTSAELTYRGLITFQDGDIPLLTQKGFQMLYTANVEAGIDLSQVQVEVSNTAVTIKLPPVEVERPTIDPDSIQFFDEKTALFNWQTKDDAVDVIKIAEEDTLENGNIEDLKAKAESQAQTLIRSLFEDAIGNRTLNIEQIEQAPTQ